jgi:hypothetical protein
MKFGKFKGKMVFEGMIWIFWGCIEWFAGQEIGSRE